MAKKAAAKKAKTDAKPKKSAAKKPVKKAGAKDAFHEKLAKELRLLIPKMDSEGLEFLVKQARIHLYNMQADELNNAAKEAYSPEKAKKDVFNIDSTGTGYYLRYQNSGTMFSQAEMTHLVKIVYGEGSQLEINERIFNWFEMERRDIFNLIPIIDKFDNQLKLFAALIKKNFKLRAKK